MTNTTREQWLIEAADLLNDCLLQGALDLDKLQLSFGFPKGSRKAIGQCFAKSQSTCKTVNAVFVSPLLHEPVEIMSVLLHELIHAVDDCKSGHKGDFARLARHLGFKTPLTQLNPSEQLTKRLTELNQELPQLDHRQLAQASQKKQSTRMLKVECTDSDCGFTFRASQTQIEKLTVAAICPACDNNHLKTA